MHMNQIMKMFLISFMMLVLGLSAATNSLNESREIQTLEEENTPQEVILSINSLNEPGFQEGSIFSDTTLSSGETHTCTILDNGDVSCWGDLDLDLHLGSNSGTFNQPTPTLTGSLGTGRTAVAISSGGDHTCARVS